MRKRYIQPVAFSIIVEEEELICSTISAVTHSYITGEDGTFYVDNHPYTLEEIKEQYPDFYKQIIDALGVTPCKAMSFSDIDVTSW